MDPHNILELALSQQAPRVPVDNEGKSAMATISGELQVATREDNVSVNFLYGPNEYDTLTSFTGTGHAGRDGSMGYVSCGTGVGSAQVESINAVRYRAGHEMQAAVSHVFAEPEENLIQRVGLINGADGWAIGYNALSAFGVWFESNGGGWEFTPSTAFEADRLDGLGENSGFLLNPQKANIYKLSYGWHGSLPLMLSVWAGYQRGWVLAHVKEVANIQDTPHLGNPSLPIRAYIERTAGTGADIRCKFGSWRAGSVAGSEEHNLADRVFEYAGVETPITGSTPSQPLQTLLGLRSKATYKGRNNHIIVEATYGQFSADGAKAVLVTLWAASQGVLDAPLAGYVDRDTESSVMEFSTATQIFTPNADEYPVASVLLNKIGQTARSLDRRGRAMFPNNEYLVCAQSAGNSEVSYVVSTVEKF